MEAGFLPREARRGQIPGYYGSRLNSVELNYTFRRFPTEKLLAGWIASTPADFKFAVKAHQTITHVKRLKDAEEWTSRFLASLAPLREAGKLGPVLFQLPPFLRCDLPRLKDFLAQLPRDTRVAFEFRHESWFSDEVFEALRGANAALCQAESEKLETPNVQTADFAYFRLRKQSYSAEERAALARTGRSSSRKKATCSLTSSTKTRRKALSTPRSCWLPRSKRKSARSQTASP